MANKHKNRQKSVVCKSECQQKYVNKKVQTYILDIWLPVIH